MPLDNEQTPDNKFLNEEDRLAFIAELHRIEDQNSIIINDGYTIMTVAQLIRNLETKDSRAMWYLLAFKGLKKNNKRREAAAQKQPLENNRGLIRRALAKIGIQL